MQQDTSQGRATASTNKTQSETAQSCSRFLRDRHLSRTVGTRSCLLPHSHLRTSSSLDVCRWCCVWRFCRPWAIWRTAAARCTCYLRHITSQLQIAHRNKRITTLRGVVVDYYLPERYFCPPLSPPLFPFFPLRSLHLFRSIPLSLLPPPSCPYLPTTPPSWGSVPTDIKFGAF